MKRTLFLGMSLCLFLQVQAQGMASGADRSVPAGGDSVVATVRYVISHQGQNFDAEFTIINDGTDPILFWDIGFDWDNHRIASVWNARLDSVIGNHYRIINVGWNSTIQPGDSVQFGCAGTCTDTSSVPENIVVTGFDPVIPPGWPRDELAVVYETLAENDSTFTGMALVANPNERYAWNGWFFGVKSIRFRTDTEIARVTNPNGAIGFEQQGDRVEVDLGWQSLFPLGARLNLTIEGRKLGQSVVLDSFHARYVRGENIRYPHYASLPPSWYPGKPDLCLADLVSDTFSYYHAPPQPVTGKLIIYQPGNPTQLQLGQVDSVPYRVNMENAARIWIPSRLVAMGIGWTCEFFKLNPNYMCGLGTKENWATGVIRENNGHSTPVVIEGDTWYWPLVTHRDGPYQQEIGNFNDCKSVFPDFLPPDANHDDYTAITPDFNHPNWISSAISCAISLTVTREFLNAIPVNYTAFMDSAADPWAEMACVTFAYNRGVWNLLARGIFETHRDSALRSTDIIRDFGLGGYADHVPTVKAITDAMNRDLHDVYDAAITWQDMGILFAKLRTFYGREVPPDSVWNRMIWDVHRAFDILAERWGGTHASCRYDYLTLLRVAKEYLPAPHNPRPTGADWYYWVTNYNPVCIIGNRKPGDVGTRLMQIRPSVTGTQLDILCAPVSPGTGAELRIYDAAGRVVRNLGPGRTVVWDIRDETGRRVPGGTYFIRMKTGTCLQVEKVVVTE